MSNEDGGFIDWVTPPEEATPTHLVFVEFEIDDPEAAPISFFVEATAEQELEIEKVVHDHIEEWMNPWVGGVTPVTFDAFMEDFRSNWINDEDDDDDEDPS